FEGSVVVTLGAEGALLVTAAGTRHFEPPQVQAVDTTGAGDAFCGAMAESLARGEPLDVAVHWAVNAGAHAVTALGAQGAMPTAADVRRIMAAD
ncbi:MAG: PfkB family carbohydrate kinase, partial [Acidimicrobiia bacterium]